MKFAEKDKPVKTIPRGVWESSRPESNKEKDKNNSTNSSTDSAITTDAQGNGYPENGQKK